MKKWIILAALAVLLVAGILIAEKLSAPDVNVNIKEETTTVGVTYSEEDLLLMKTTWEEYQAMTSEEQQNFKKSFSSLQVYIDWYWDAKAAYDAKQNVEVIGPGQSINIGDLIGSAE